MAVARRAITALPEIADRKTPLGSTKTIRHKPAVQFALADAEAQFRMLEVARRLFAERDYAETTIEAIARAADVAVPTVYAAFQSKRGVLSAL